MYLVKKLTIIITQISFNVALKVAMEEKGE